MFSTETWMWEEKQLRVVVHPCVWWLKSCTTLDVWNPKNHGINYQPQLVSLPGFFSINSRLSLLIIRVPIFMLLLYSSTTHDLPGKLHIQQPRGRSCQNSRASWGKNMLGVPSNMAMSHKMSIYRAFMEIHGMVSFEVPWTKRSVFQKKSSRSRRRSLEPYSLDLNKKHEIKKFQRVRNVC